MIIKGIRDEDFCQYKKSSMFIIFPSCTFKCEKECGIECCQNSSIAKAKDIEVDCETLVKRYTNNPITKAIVFGGLEPLDSLWDVEKLIFEFRQVTQDDIVIYTGYTREELVDKKHPLYQGTDILSLLKQFPNIIIKFGRYIPNSKSRYDEELGITLVSDNQYAVKIS